MQQKIGFAVAAAVALAIALYFVSGRALAPTCGYTIDSYPEHNLLDIIASAVDEGVRINTAGFVLHSYTCPPCPADAQCKPCMTNSVVIGNELQPIHSFSDVDPAKHLLVEVPDPTAFRKDNRYLFSVAPKANGGTALRSVEFFACSRAP